MRQSLNWFQKMMFFLVLVIIFMLIYNVKKTNELIDIQNQNQDFKNVQASMLIYYKKIEYLFEKQDKQREMEFSLFYRSINDQIKNSCQSDEKKSTSNEP